MNITDKVQAMLATALPSLADRAADSIASAEITRQVTAIATVWEKLRQAERRLSSVRPDSLAFDADGKPVQENWTRAGLKLKDEARKEVERLTNAINKALGGDPAAVFAIANARPGESKGGGGTSDGLGKEAG